MPQPDQTARASLSRASGTRAVGNAPSAIEYAIIAVLIAAVAVGTWKTFGETPQPEPSGDRAAP
jgi:hypothetical protein